MTANQTVSICIPVYNAAAFLDETLSALRRQTYRQLDIVVVDNCSNDGSLAIAERHAADDPRVRIVRNRCNIGFAANLDKAASLATGELMMIHFADDTSEPEAIAKMVAVFQRPDVNPENTVVITDEYFMTADGTRRGVLTRGRDDFGNRFVDLADYRPEPGLLDRFTGLTALRQAMPRLRIVGWIGAVMYSRALRDAVEGARSGRLSNPDKHYMYKLLAQNPDVVWIHEPLFSWRWHDANQDAQERGGEAIKQSLDEYIYTFEYSDAALDAWGVDRKAMIHSFVDRACLRKALSEIAHGSRLLAFRYLCFALATYPRVALRNRKFYAGAAGVMLGPLGSALARVGHKRGVWRARVEPTV